MLLEMLVGELQVIEFHFQHNIGIPVALESHELQQFEAAGIVADVILNLAVVCLELTVLFFAGVVYDVPEDQFEQPRGLQHCSLAYRGFMLQPTRELFKHLFVCWLVLFRTRVRCAAVGFACRKLFKHCCQSFGH